MANVFLSYSRADKQYAEVLAELLHRRGSTVWWDTELIPAERFRDRILEEIGNSDVVVVLWSENSRNSTWVPDEAMLALDQEKLIQISLDGEPQPTGFGQATINCLDLSGWDIEDISTLDNSLFESIETFIPKRASVEVLRQRLTEDIELSRKQLKSLKNYMKLMTAGVVGCIALAGASFFGIGDKNGTSTVDIDETIDSKIAASLSQGGAISEQYVPVHSSFEKRIDTLEKEVAEEQPLKPLLMGVKNNLVNGAEFPIELEDEGLLIVSLNVENNEGGSGGQNRKTIFSRSQIILNQEICSDDYSAYYVWDGVAMANSVCMKHLKPGTHNLVFNSSSSKANSTKNRVSFVVIPMADND